jgi:hypothetical protein
MMTNVLILGANGLLARNTTPVLLESPDIYLTLYLRHARRLQNSDPTRARVVEGDVTDRTVLDAAMQGQDVVYANLSGDMARQARSIVVSMKANGVRRFVFISSMGIYGEVPGERYRSVLDPYRDSAALVEASDLDYTAKGKDSCVKENSDTTGAAGRHCLEDATTGESICLARLTASLQRQIKIVAIMESVARVDRVPTPPFARPCSPVEGGRSVDFHISP